MGSDLVFLDVETPNGRNDRVCSIGMVRTDSALNELGRLSLLIDPEEEFSPVNVGITGIDGSAVRGMGNFLDAWDGGIRDMIDGARVVAHNATFDLGVMDKAMTAYGIEHGRVSYACTMRLAHRHIGGLQNYRLDTVSMACDAALDSHHDALCDALACEGVFSYLQDCYAVIEDGSTWLEYLPQSARRTERVRRMESRKSEATKSMESLMGLASSIVGDGHVTLAESVSLAEMIENDPNLSCSTVGRKLLAQLGAAIMDGKIDGEEEAAIKASINALLDPVSAVSDDMGDIDGKTYCLTGDFDFGSKDEIEERLASLGGKRSKSVTKSCDYVIVGSNGSARWSFGSYGSKVMKALEWQGKGHDVRIVREADCAYLAK